MLSTPWTSEKNQTCEISYLKDVTVWASGEIHSFAVEKKEKHVVEMNEKGR